MVLHKIVYIPKVGRFALGASRESTRNRRAPIRTRSGPLFLSFLRFCFPFVTAFPLGVTASNAGNLAERSYLQRTNNPNNGTTIRCASTKRNKLVRQQKFVRARITYTSSTTRVRATKTKTKTYRRRAVQSVSSTALACTLH